MKKIPFKIISVNRSEKKGVIKHPVETANLIPGLGMEGDAHAAPGNRQLSLLAQEDIEVMKKKKSDIKPGDFAENFTTVGVSLPDLPIGTEMHIGETVLKVSKIGKECHHGCEILRIVGSCIMPKRGIFVEVIEGGEVSCESPCYYCQ